MALQFICGSSISERSKKVQETVCALAVKEPERQILFLVPEQATLTVQRELVRIHPRHVLGNVDVLSFGRLAHRVLQEGGRKQPVLLDDTGKTMMIHRIAAENADGLELFSKSLRQPGFVRELKSVISELAAYGVTEEDLFEARGKIKDEALARKLRDVSRIYEAFHTKLGGDYLSQEELLFLLAERLPESKLAAGSLVVLDGFTGFTPLQYTVLGSLLGRAKDVICCVTIDEACYSWFLAGCSGSSPARAELFSMSLEMMTKLSRLAGQNGMACRNSFHRFIGETRPADAALVHLERNLYAPRTAPMRFSGEAAGIRLLAAANPAAEVSACLAGVLSLIRSGKYHYRDIAVVSGDLDLYRNEVDRQFKAAGLPYFIDQKKDLKDNPLFSLVSGALTVLDQSASYDAMMSFLKNPLVQIEQDRLDRLDNYLLAGGISGWRRFAEPWIYPFDRAGEDELVWLNELRLRILGWFTPLKDAWNDRDKPVRERLEALFVFVQGFSPAARLKEMSEAFAEQKEYDRQSEYSQVYGKFTGLLDQIAKLMGDQKVEPRLLTDLVESGSSELRVGFLPASIDRLVIGDLERTRLENIRVLFVLGANDGILPKTVSRGGIFSDYEREMLSDSGLVLAPRARDEAFRQKYYLYLCLTKPSDRLILSSSAVSAEGKPLRKAHLVSQLTHIFPDLVEVRAEEEFAGLKGLSTPKEGLTRLAVGLRLQLDGGTGAWWMPLLAWYRSAGYERELAQMYDALFYAYRSEKLDAVIAGRLFGKGRRMPVTSLESYASCAYAHFLKSGLGLSPRREAKLNAADYGTLFHEALSNFFRLLDEEGPEWSLITEEREEELVDRAVEQALRDAQTNIFVQSARNKNTARRIRSMTLETVDALTDQWKAGKYRKTFHETDFRELGSEDGLSLLGRIDRIDIAEADGKLYVKIIDYKTGKTTIDLAKLIYGLQLQPALYQGAALGMFAGDYPGLEAQPAGFYFYNLKDPVIKGFPANEAEMKKRLRKALLMHGLTSSDRTALRLIDEEGGRVVSSLDYNKKTGEVSAKALVASPEQMRRVIRFGRKKSKELADLLFDGEIGANPYEYGKSTPCDYCEMKAVCGFEAGTEGCHFRRQKKMNREEALALICREAGEDGSKLD